MNDWLVPLRRILDRSPEPVRFFFRDHSVGREYGRLYELLDVFAAHEIPINLGVIPDALSGAPDRKPHARRIITSGKLALHVRRLAVVDHKVAAQLLVEPTVRKVGDRSAEASAEPSETRKVSPISGKVAARSTAGGAASAFSPVRIDWCRHAVGENRAAREILGRYLAVVATRRQPIEIILDHAYITGRELVAIEELLLLLTNHRKAHCLLLRELTEFPSANDEGRDVSASAPVQLPATTADPMRGWLNRVRHARPHVRWLWLAAVIGVAGAIGWQWLTGAKPGTDFLTAQVLRGSIEDTVLAAGTLEPYAYVDVGAQTSGQLKSLHVHLGDRVTNGQLLAEIDPLLSASKVAGATATLANLQAQWEGKKAQFQLARLQKSRSDDLLRQGAQAASDSEIAEATYKLTHSALEALAAQIKQARAELETAQANLAYTRIVAPMSGEVVSITALEGQTLNATQQAPTILRIAQLDTMTVWALVPEADVSRLRVGQDVYFTILGQGERRWQGRLRQVLPSPQVIANVVFYNALFDVPNPRRELKVQMTAQVFFVLAQANNALYVPLSALPQNQPAQPGPATVSVLKNDGRVETRKVRIGIVNAVSAQILGGLTEGEIVVTGAPALTQDHLKPNSVHHVKPR